MADAKRDNNRVPVIQGVSNADGTTPLTPYVDSSTNRLLVNATISGGGAGGTSSTDNSAFTFGTTSITPIGGVVDDVATNAVSENNTGAARITGQRALHVNLRDNSGTELGTVASPLNVSGTVTTSIGAIGTTNINLVQVNGVTPSVGNGVSGTGVLRVTLASDSTGQVALASGSNTFGTVSVNSLPAVSGTVNINQTQVNGIALSTGNGVSGTGVQRVTIASDSTGQIALAAGANTIGALTANQSVNNAQVSGTAISVGNGVSGTGVQRVTLASDSTGQVTLATGANTIGALTANQSVNNAQVSGTTISVGNGVSGTGVQRVTIASDSTGQIALASGGNTVGTVSVNSMPAVTGTVNVNLVQVAGGTAITSGVTGSQAVGGDTANAASDAGNPVKIGGVGKTANPTAVSDGQRVNALFDKLGKQVVVGAVRDLKGKQFTTIYTSTGTTTVVTAVASTFLDVYGCIVTNRASASNLVTFTDSANGSAVFSFEVPATDTRGFMLPVDSAIPMASSGNIWQATCGTSGSVEVTMLYVKNI